MRATEAANVDGDTTASPTATAKTSDADDIDRAVEDDTALAATATPKAAARTAGTSDTETAKTQSEVQAKTGGPISLIAMPRASGGGTTGVNDTAAVTSARVGVDHARNPSSHNHRHRRIHRIVTATVTALHRCHRHSIINNTSHRQLPRWPTCPVWQQRPLSIFQHPTRSSAPMTAW